VNLDNASQCAIRSLVPQLRAITSTYRWYICARVRSALLRRRGSTSDHCLCQPACSVSVYASVHRSTSPRAPPAPSLSPRAGIQTRLRALPAPVNTTLLAAALQISSLRCQSPWHPGIAPRFFHPYVNCNRHPVRLRAQLEAEGQGTSLCTVCPSSCEFIH
jgi:hypothetical protein